MIKDVLLEKRIVYDNSLINRKMTIYNMTDLKSYYDRQLAKIGSIIQELVGVESLLIKLFTKLLQVIEHHICTSYGASKTYYKGLQEKQASTEEGHILSVNIYRDLICLIFMNIQNQNLRIIIIESILKQEE